MHAVAMLLLAASLVHAEAPSRVASVVRADKRTGRLVRTVVTRPSAKAAPAVNVGAIIEKTAARHEVDPLLVHSVIQVESGYNPHAVSPKGAQGLMQLIPATAKRFGVANPFDMEANIEGGVKYLKYLQDMFQDQRLALAAYNAGEGAVLRHRGVPPYRETEEYVERVGKRYGEARNSASLSPEAAAPTSPEGGEEPVRSLESYLDAEGRLYLRTR